MSDKVWLSHVTIDNCRIIQRASLELSDSMNFFIGDNAQGKTSILEALSVLSHGRSFRSSNLNDVRHHEKDVLRVTAELKKGQERIAHIGVERSKAATVIRLNKQTIKTQSELSKQLPFTFIHPLSQDLILGSSGIRRRFLDWLSFYLFDDFHYFWRQYHLVLRQRNAALKDKRQYYSLPTLTKQLSELLPKLINYREQSLNRLNTSLTSLVSTYPKSITPILNLKPLFPNIEEISTDSIYNFYSENLDKEKRRQRTLYGFHLADLEIKDHQHKAATTSSRGQIRLMTILLLIAQSHTIPHRGILAIDDLGSELDKTHQNELLEFLVEQGQQLFITSTRALSCSPTIPSKMFHVEQGIVS